MHLKFRVRGLPVEFRRNWFTGAARLTTPSGEIMLQSSADLGTHFSLSLKQTWQAEVMGELVSIVKTRPLLLAGFRPHCYEILVEGRPVAAAKGY